MVAEKPSIADALAVVYVRILRKELIKKVWCTCIHSQERVSEVRRFFFAFNNFIVFYVLVSTFPQFRRFTIIHTTGKRTKVKFTVTSVKGHLFYREFPSQYQDRSDGSANFCSTRRLYDYLPLLL